MVRSSPTWHVDSCPRRLVPRDDRAKRDAHESLLRCRRRMRDLVLSRRCLCSDHHPPGSCRLFATLGWKTHFFGVGGGIIYERDDETLFLSRDGGLEVLVGSWASSEFGFLEPTSDVSSCEIFHAIQGHPVARAKEPTCFLPRETLLVSSCLCKPS